MSLTIDLSTIPTRIEQPQTGPEKIIKTLSITTLTLSVISIIGQIAYCEIQEADTSISLNSSKVKMFTNWTCIDIATPTQIHLFQASIIAGVISGASVCFWYLRKKCSLF